MSIQLKTTILKPKELYYPDVGRFWHHDDFNQIEYLKYCLSDYAGLNEVLDWVSKKNLESSIKYGDIFGYSETSSGFFRSCSREYDLHDNFKTKDELYVAIKFHTDPHPDRTSQSKKDFAYCSYCSNELEYEIRLILWEEIFYRRPPTGIRDLRIVHKTLWENIAHVNRKCSKCGNNANYWTSYRKLDKVPEYYYKKRSLLDKILNI